MQVWEYKTFKIDAKGLMGGIVDTDEFELKLNLLGQQGWNLVSVFDSNMAYGQSREIVAVLKREKQA